MVANCGGDPVPLALDLGNLAAKRCRIVDDGRTWEDAALPDALPPRSFVLVEA